jgi:dynein heavy chain 1
VDALAESLRVVLHSVAMGSEEGYETADRLISSAASQGTWVLLRNIHLCPTWLEALEKRLHKLSASLDPRFRLFLTSEIHPKLPPSLLRLCDVMVLEAPTGIKANVQRLLSGLPPQRSAGPPAEKARLFFLVAWFHAVVQERRRYVPLGWSKRYEFSQADAQAALDAVEGWVEGAAGGLIMMAVGGCVGVCMQEWCV